MAQLWNTRFQGIVAMILFLGSLITLLYNLFAGGTWLYRERAMQAGLEQATHRMAQLAEGVIPPLTLNNASHPTDLHRSLANVTIRALTPYPDIEGGFYLKDIDQFSGYGFPSSPTHYPGDPNRTEPPPLEAPLIRAQAQQSMNESRWLLTVREVGPSRVMVATDPVGKERPARVAAWAMTRLTGPEQLESQLHRYQLSVGLALGGLALALILTMTMSRSLAHQRASEERLRDELRRTEHLASLGRLLAGVAHEIRNPLAGIRSTIQLWQRQRDPATVMGTIETVLHETERMNAILTRLLHFARTDQAARQANDMNVLLAETTKLLQAQATAQGVTTTVESTSELPAVWGSSVALRQVFLNVIMNALQAMPTGGQLVCRTRYGAGKHSIEIDVTDTGPGIAPEDRLHLFEPFFTTRPDGTGLGLALCREILSQHGGAISLRVDDGPGTTFTIVLPVAEG